MNGSEYVAAAISACMSLRHEGEGSKEGADDRMVECLLMEKYNIIGHVRDTVVGLWRG